MSACTCGKRRYLSRAQARQAARVARGRGEAQVRLWEYKCGGGFWHLTSQPRNRAGRMRAKGWW